MNKICPHCHREFTKQTEIDFIENFSMCPSCDHLVSQEIGDRKASAKQVDEIEPKLFPEDF